MKWALYILCLIACANLYGQKKFLTAIDTNAVANNRYTDQNGTSSVLNSGLGEQIMELDHFDGDMLAAIVVSKINEYRASKNKKMFTISKPLLAVAEAYVKRYHSSRFGSNGSNYYKLKRILNGISKYIWLSYKLYDGYVASPIIADYKRGAYYYDKDSDTDLKLFYGTRKPRPNEDFEVEPIEAKTYNEVADELVKKWFSNRSSQMLKGEIYQFIAIKTVLDLKSVHRNSRLPKIKAIFIVGGKRNNMILNELN